ncbi:MAG: VanZ family protein, partial [Planctomycetes bacterium]|nr:VanZ family protein [Planctomycetota bacterium]
MLARVRWLLGALCFVSLAYTLYPLDFVISWEELYEKKTLGRLSYSFSLDELISLAGVKGVIIAAAKVFPFGAWTGLTFPKRFPWLTITVIAIALEAIQIPIYSKFATEWEAIAGVVGGAVGWIAARYWPTWIACFDQRWIWGCLALAWSGILVVFFNSRFTHVLRDDKEIAQRWTDFWTPPLLRYYYTSEYSAISNLLGKIGMFMILGICMYLTYWTRGSSQAIRKWFCVGVVWSILLGIIIEAGQIFLPPLVPDAFDIAIYAVGFAFGFILSALICGDRDASSRSIYNTIGSIDRSGLRLVTIRTVAALIAITLAFLIWWYFPFARYELGIATLVYALVLWRWTSLALPSIPTILACVNLMPFTGWIWVGELEIFLLIAFSISVLRYEIQPFDLFPSGVSRYLLAALGIVQLIGLMIGLVDPESSFWESANPYLHPFNSWRATKGFWLALVFLPIIRYELRTDASTKNRFFIGVVLAASVVSLGGISERILYPGFFDFQSDYRIVSSWFDMHLGGSQIAIFFSLTVPAVLWFLIYERGFTVRFLSFIVLIAVLYCLIISYARAAIAITLLGGLLLAMIMAISFRYRERRVLSPSTRWGIPFAIVFGALVLAIGAWNIPFFRSRLYSILPDFDTRLANWKTAFEQPDASSPIQWLVGHGSGCYPRMQFELSKDTATSNLILQMEEKDNHLRIESRSTLYIGQKITVDRKK